MRKALQAIERSYTRAPLRSFVISQKQFAKRNLMSVRDVAMQHNVKKEVK